LPWYKKTTDKFFPEEPQKILGGQGVHEVSLLEEKITILRAKEYFDHVFTEDAAVILQSSDTDAILRELRQEFGNKAPQQPVPSPPPLQVPVRNNSPMLHPSEWRQGQPNFPQVLTQSPLPCGNEPKGIPCEDRLVE